jgi:hypothetical protein
MTNSSHETTNVGVGEWPTVTIVFLVFDRRDELRTSLRKMLLESDYDPDKVEVIVVDNGSSDGSAAMVVEEFPQVRLIRRTTNCGVSGWNEGFAVARGDYVLALDDDCYLPPDGLRRSIAAAREHDADLVSFRVISTADPEWVFSDEYRTGLFMFWGCAVLVRREPLQQLVGYDPEIFVWANELEFMIRFLDRGYRHLHLPDVVAQHMKEPPAKADTWIGERGYRINARHWGYIAAKLLQRRDAAEALVALLARNVRDGLREDRTALKALPDTVKGFVHGLRHREPVRKAELSHFYRRNFETFASPWWIARPPGQLLRELPRETLRGSRPKNVGRRAEYYAERAPYYPDEPATLKF